MSTYFTKIPVLRLQRGMSLNREFKDYDGEHDKLGRCHILSPTAFVRHSHSGIPGSVQWLPMLKRLGWHRLGPVG